MNFKIIKTILFVFVLVVVAAAVFMAYKDIRSSMPKVDGGLSENFEEGKLKICLYKATWCGHCTKYLQSGVFDSTYESIKGKPEYADVVFATIDFDENKDSAEKYNVNSFPSIIAIDKQGNLISRFEGDRYKSEELIKFVDESKNKA